MAVSGYVFGKAPIAWLNKEVDILDDAINVSLHTSSYTPDQDTHDYFNDVTNEVSSAGYTARGQAIANDTLTYTAGTNVLMYDGDDVSWSGVTFSARYAVIHDDTPASDATRPLIGYQDFGATLSPSAGTFTIAWSASGIMTLTAA